MDRLVKAAVLAWPARTASAFCERSAPQRKKKGEEERGVRSEKGGRGGGTFPEEPKRKPTRLAVAEGVEEVIGAGGERAVQPEAGPASPEGHGSCAKGANTQGRAVKGEMGRGNRHLSETKRAGPAGGKKKPEKPKTTRIVTPGAPRSFAVSAAICLSNKATVSAYCGETAGKRRGRAEINRCTGSEGKGEERRAFRANVSRKGEPGLL